MRAINAKWLVGAIPLIFTIGLLLFFVLLPPEQISLTNLVAYASSWSTVIMVLIYVFTNSRQLGIMQKQLDEMNFTRGVQFQPLVYPSEPKVSMEFPTFFSGPESQFKKMELMCRLFVDFSVVNLGNGPAVEIDIIPKIMKAGYSMGSKKPATEIVYGMSERIDCISLKEKDEKEVFFLIFDKQVNVPESLLSNRTYIECTVLFKNVVGMTFKEKFSFDLSLKNLEEDSKILKDCLRTAKTAELDFGDKKKEFESLRKKGDKEQSQKIIESVRNDLKERFKDCNEGKQEMKLNASLSSGSFSITPISISEYEKLLRERDTSIEQILFNNK